MSVLARVGGRGHPDPERRFQLHAWTINADAVPIATRVPCVLHGRAFDPDAFGANFRCGLPGGRGFSPDASARIRDRD